MKYLIVTFFFLSFQIFAEQRPGLYIKGPIVKQSQQLLKKACGRDLKCNNESEKDKLLEIQEQIKDQDLQVFKEMMEQLPLTIRSKFLKNVFMVNDNYQIIGRFKDKNDWFVQTQQRFNDFLNDKNYLNDLVNSYKETPKINFEKFKKSAYEYQRVTHLHGLLSSYCDSFIENALKKTQCLAKRTYPMIKLIPYQPERYTLRKQLDCNNLEDKTKKIDNKVKLYAEKGMLHRYLSEINREKATLSKCINWCTEKVINKYPYACSKNSSSDIDEPTQFVEIKPTNNSSMQMCQETFNETYNQENRFNIQFFSSHLELFRPKVELLIGGLEETEEYNYPDQVEFFSAYNPHKMTVSKIPTLLRMSAIGQSVNAYCDLTGQKVDPPLQCSNYYEDLSSFQCNKDTIALELNPTSREKVIKIIKTSKIIKRLYSNSKILNDIIYKLQLAYIPHTAPRGQYSKKLITTLESINAEQSIIDNVKKFSSNFNNRHEVNKFLQNMLQNYQKLKNTIDHQIIKYTSDEPFLFTDASIDSPIEEQDFSDFQLLSSLSEMDLQKLDPNKYEKIINKTLKSSKIKFEKYLANLCDNENGIKDYQLIRMKEFTKPFLSIFPDLAMTHYCLENLTSPEDVANTLESVIFYGGLTTCLVGALGPQGVLVGGACGLLYASYDTLKFNNEKDEFSKLIDCRVTTGSKAKCSEQAYLKGKEEFKDAWTTLKLSVALLPLDIMAPGFLQEIKGLIQKVKPSAQDATKVIRMFQQRVDDIYELTDNSLKQMKINQLLSDVDELKTANYDGGKEPALQIIARSLMNDQYDQLLRKAKYSRLSVELLQENVLYRYPFLDLIESQHRSDIFRVFYNDARNQQRFFRLIVPRQTEGLTLQFITQTFPQFRGMNAVEISDVMYDLAIKSINEMPVDLLKTVREIRINPSYLSGNDDVWGHAILRDRKKEFIHRGVLVDEVHVKSQSIDIFLNGWVGGSNELSETLSHELGHTLALELYGHATPNHIYKLAKAQDSNEISKYGAKSLSEDFAEAIRVFVATDGGVLNPELLKKYSNRFKIFEQVFQFDNKRRAALIERVKRKMNDKGIDWKTDGKGAILYVAIRHDYSEK